MSKPATSPNKQEMPLPARSIAHARRALRHRNFQLFVAGQSISVIGTWMTRLATSWLVYRLTHSALLLGVVGFAGQIISFALGPLAGVWVERLDRRKLLVWTQAAAAVQSLAMAALTLAHAITLWEIIALTASTGIDQCVRHACSPILPGADG
jgi:MFS family permease